MKKYLLVVATLLFFISPGLVFAWDTNPGTYGRVQSSESYWRGWTNDFNLTSFGSYKGFYAYYEDYIEDFVLAEIDETYPYYMVFVGDYTLGSTAMNYMTWYFEESDLAVIENYDFYIQNSRYTNPSNYYRTEIDFYDGQTGMDTKILSCETDGEISCSTGTSSTGNFMISYYEAWDSHQFNATYSGVEAIPDTVYLKTNIPAEYLDTIGIYYEKYAYGFNYYDSENNATLYQGTSHIKIFDTIDEWQEAGYWYLQIANPTSTDEVIKNVPEYVQKKSTEISNIATITNGVLGGNSDFQNFLLWCYSACWVLIISREVRR